VGCSDAPGKQLGVQCLAQGHFHLQLMGRAGIEPTTLGLQDGPLTPLSYSRPPLYNRKDTRKGHPQPIGSPSRRMLNACKTVCVCVCVCRIVWALYLEKFLLIDRCWDNLLWPLSVACWVLASPLVSTLRNGRWIFMQQQRVDGGTDGHEKELGWIKKDLPVSPFGAMQTCLTFPAAMSNLFFTTRAAQTRDNEVAEMCVSPQSDSQDAMTTHMHTHM